MHVSQTQHERIGEAMVFIGRTAGRGNMQLREEENGAVEVALAVPLLEGGHVATLALRYSPSGVLLNVALERPTHLLDADVEARAKLIAQDRIDGALRGIRALALDYAEMDGEHHKQYALVKIAEIAGGDITQIDDLGIPA